MKIENILSWKQNIYHSIPVVKIQLEKLKKFTRNEFWVIENADKKHTHDALYQWSSGYLSMHCW